MSDAVPSSLDRAISKTLFKRKTQGGFRQLTLNPPDSIDFSSNDFLSLATSPALRQHYLHQLQTNWSALGSGGSRLLDGNSACAEALEQEIAAFHGGETGLLCNSGFDANVSIFSTIPQPGDVVVYDEYIHASVHDGMRLSRAGRCVAFAHNDVEALRAVLKECLESDEGVRAGARNVFVAVEGVYSMDGDVAPLKEVVRLVHSLLPERNGYLIVDEAHSTGVFGAHGRGLVCELGLEDEFAIRLHTFGKAMACNGATILCSPLIRQYLINYARPLIYTTFMSFPALAAIKASYSMLVSGGIEPARRHLWALIQALHERLQHLKAQLEPALLQSPTLLQISPEPPRSPIFSILSSEPKVLAAYCQRNGLVVRGIVAPTVPVGAERIRICLHAGNREEDLERLVEVIRGWTLQRVGSMDVSRQNSAQLRARL